MEASKDTAGETAGTKRPKRRRRRVDAFLKRFFDHPKSVEGLLRIHAPAALAERLDYATLERMPGDFVTGDLRTRTCDRIWRLRCDDGKGGRKWCYLHVLVEFQSTPDRWMVLRVILYMVLLWLDLIARKVIGPKDLLPPVLPIVYYDGARKWKFPTNLEEMLDPTTRLLWEHIGEFALLNVGEISLDTIRDPANPVFHLLTLEQGALRGADLMTLLRAILQGAISLPEDCGEQARMLLLWLVGPGSNTGLAERLALNLTMKEDDPMLGEKIRKALEAYEQKLMAESEKRGLARGVAEGEARGEARGKAEGRVEGALEKGLRVARNLLLRGASCEDVSDIAELPLEDVERLAAELRGSPA